MSVCSDDLMSVANKLAQSELEIERRTAINRSYYAVYHDLVQVLDSFAKHGSGEHGLPAHAEINRCLSSLKSEHPEKKIAFAYGAEAAGLASTYSSLRKTRGVADYALDNTSEFEPRNLVLHLGRVERLRKFAAKLAAAS